MNMKVTYRNLNLKCLVLNDVEFVEEAMRDCSERYMFQENIQNPLTIPIYSICISILKN